MLHLTSFNAVVLKRSGLTDKYLFQESDLVVIEEVEESEFEEKKIFITITIFQMKTNKI